MTRQNIDVITAENTTLRSAYQDIVGEINVLYDVSRLTNPNLIFCAEPSCNVFTGIQSASGTSCRDVAG